MAVLTLRPKLLHPQALFGVLHPCVCGHCKRLSSSSLRAAGSRCCVDSPACRSRPRLPSFAGLPTPVRSCFQPFCQVQALYEGPTHIGAVDQRRTYGTVPLHHGRPAMRCRSSFSTSPAALACQETRRLVIHTKCHLPANAYAARVACTGVPQLVHAAHCFQDYIRHYAACLLSAMLEALNLTC